MSDLQNNDRLPLGSAPATMRAQDAVADGQRHALACLFETRATAERAAEDLTGEGIDRSAIDIIDHGGADAEGLDAGRDTEERGGMWESIKRLFTGSDEGETYYEGVNRGQTLLSVRVRDRAEADRVGVILERHDPIDLDTQEETWRRAGGTGGTGTAPAAPASAAMVGQGAAPLDVTAPGFAAERATPAVSPTPHDARPATAATASAATGEQVIPLVEEKLAVGKRAVQGGRVRVHTMVVETPVEQDVRLRDERVEIARRKVDRSTAVGPEAFRERTVELTESREEAVVGKTARVTEEVVVRKETAERTERVADTVRHTEVKVDKEPSPARTAGPAAASPPRR